jgi:hypothetical protein
MTQHFLTSSLSSLAFRVLGLDFGQNAVTNNLPGASATALASPSTGFGLLITQILNILLTIGVIAVLFFLLWGGLEWITAGGDSGKITKAREKMTGAVIGLVVLISTTAILMFVQQLLGICVVNFGGTSCQTGSGGGAPPSTTCTGTCVPAAVECTENSGTLIAGSCSNQRYCCRF